MTCVPDQDWAVLDLEASALPPRSYPIEIAVAFPDASVSAWLIRPAPVWLRDGTWDPAAEGLHGLSRAMLQGQGESPGDVVEQVAAAVRGRRVLSDNIAADSYWLGVLCAAARIRPPPFHLTDFWQWSEPLASPRERERALAEAYRRHPARHRAAPDARRIACAISLLLDRPFGKTDAAAM
ncbi:hypothetical protein IGS68_00780 [Skermanella sp. TT6]|uniref:Exonuclease domain-containing protein n=1 Tax=Skermanella cutis TaxID=2775420 RepID=A0ABX7B650_9PROT|nr:hypothetical protein [Skermanella sp. TT6]QQP89849.1 hypothetical protein IGS68_00780 [Skermanella sp. TT6]